MRHQLDVDAQIMKATMWKMEVLAVTTGPQTVVNRKTGKAIGLGKRVMIMRRKMYSFYVRSCWMGCSIKMTGKVSRQ